MKKIILTTLICMLAIPMMAQSKATKGYVDLGLPSGTLWKITNETGLYDFFDASNKHQAALPTGDQWSELRDYCTWTWTNKGYKVIGTNGNFIILPADGFRYPDNQRTEAVGQTGAYWSSTVDILEEDAEGIHFDDAYGLFFFPNSEDIKLEAIPPDNKLAIRLVMNP